MDVMKESQKNLQSIKQVDVGGGSALKSDLNSMRYARLNTGDAELHPADLGGAVKRTLGVPEN